MSSTHDPFSARFDAIEIDPARAPSPQAIADAFALAAPTAAVPDLATAGFYLVDDADGRFVIDREMGVVSLKDEAILERERFSVHIARMRVIEHTGESYEIELKLRLTGLVPQMVGAEDALFDLPAPETQTAAPALVRPALRPATQAVHWTAYAAARTQGGKAEIARTRRSFITQELPAASPVLAHATLHLTTELPPVGLRGAWSL